MKWLVLVLLLLSACHTSSCEPQVHPKAPRCEGPSFDGVHFTKPVCPEGEVPRCVTP